jgi:putative phosphoesterase
MPNLAVISDIHGNLANLEKVLHYITSHKIDYLICTGDVCGIDAWQIIDNLKIPSWAVHGNADNYGLDLSVLKNIKVFEEFGEITLAEKKIIFCHYPEVVKKFIADNPGKYQLALHGHSHQPWEENYQGTKLLNPGNVANVRYAPTFAIIDLDTLKAQLILINDL